MQSFEIGKNEAGQRFDKYLKKRLPNAGSSFIYKMLRKKNITLNDKKATGNEMLEVTDVVKMFFADETYEKFAGSISKVASSYQHYSLEDLKKAHLYINYEDEDILIFEKPTGMLSQKANPNDVSINEYLIGYLLATGQLHEADLSTFKPSAANRLDRNTAGLILCSKSLQGAQFLTSLIKERKIKKEYRCIVVGNLQKSLHLDGYICKDEKLNKVAIVKEIPTANADIITASKYEAVKTNIDSMGHYRYKGKDYTEILVHLITGKSHQIRAHLSSIKQPLIGDHKYGFDDALTTDFRLKSQLLCSYRLTFPVCDGAFAHLSGMVCTAKLEPKYQKVLDVLKNGNME